LNSNLTENIWESDTLDIMDIHGYHGYPWPLLDIYMDMDMVDILDIHVGGIMDIQHGHPFWICMDVNMVDIQKDIQNTYPYRISMSI